MCALSGLLGLVSVSLVLMGQRSGVPFSFNLSSGSDAPHSYQLSRKCFGCHWSQKWLDKSGTLCHWGSLA